MIIINLRKAPANDESLTKKIWALSVSYVIQLTYEADFSLASSAPQVATRWCSAAAQLLSRDGDHSTHLKATPPSDLAISREHNVVSRWCSDAVVCEAAFPFCRLGVLGKDDAGSFNDRVDL